MKTVICAAVLFSALFIFSITNAQEQAKTTALPAQQTNQPVETKAQNNNTVRSNRTESKASIDQTNTGSQGINSNASKKGYDYYQSKSELNSGGQTKAQDHNSSRSNKSSSIVAPNNPETGGNADEKAILPNDKTDKSEAARAKKKKY